MEIQTTISNEQIITIEFNKIKATVIMKDNAFHSASLTDPHAGMFTWKTPTQVNDAMKNLNERTAVLEALSEAVNKAIEQKPPDTLSPQDVCRECSQIKICTDLDKKHCPGYHLSVTPPKDILSNSDTPSPACAADAELAEAGSFAPPKDESSSEKYITVSGGGHTRSTEYTPKDR